MTSLNPDYPKKLTALRYIAGILGLIAGSAPVIYMITLLCLIPLIIPLSLFGIYLAWATGQSSNWTGLLLQSSIFFILSIILPIIAIIALKKPFISSPILLVVGIVFISFEVSIVPPIFLTVNGILLIIAGLLHSTTWLLGRRYKSNQPQYS